MMKLCLMLVISYAPYSQARTPLGNASTTQYPDLTSLHKLVKSAKILSKHERFQRTESLVESFFAPLRG